MAMWREGRRREEDRRAPSEVIDGASISASEMNVLDLSNATASASGELALNITHDGSSYNMEWVPNNVARGSFYWSKVNVKDSGTSYTIDSDSGAQDHIIALEMSTINAAFGVNLESGDGTYLGREIIVKDVDGGADRTNYMRVNAGTGNTVDGRAYADMTVAYGVIHVVCTKDNLDSNGDAQSTGNEWSIVNRPLL